MKCPICGEDADKEYVVKELQLGLREEFIYVECSKSGCLFLKDIPEDMSKYYDKNYAPHKNKDSFRNKLISKFVGSYLSNNYVLSKFAPSDKIPPIAKLINQLYSNHYINSNSSILYGYCK